MILLLDPFKTKRKRTKEWKYTSHVFGEDATTKLRERKKKFISVMKKNEAKWQLRAQPISKWYIIYQKKKEKSGIVNLQRHYDSVTATSPSQYSSKKEKTETKKKCNS